MLSQPVFEFTPVRAPHEAVVNIAWVKLHRMFAPLPFFMQHLSKSSFCYEQAVGQTPFSVSVYQSASHVIPTRMPSIQNNTRISLFVTELYLRNWVSGHHVSAFSRPTGVQLSHRESMIQLPSLLLNASVLPCQAQGICVGTQQLVL